MRTETVTRPILPVSLLVAGKPCLVVGGGRIAARKVRHLLEAEAEVTVVSPEVSAAIALLARRGRIGLAARAFVDTDVAGRCLVFAATDNAEVNRRVLACCRGQRVMCCACDGNWPEGDFVTPAVCRGKGVTVAVATGGRSCQQARVIKEKIAQWLDTLADVKEESGAHDASHHTS